MNKEHELNAESKKHVLAMETIEFSSGIHAAKYLGLKDTCAEDVFEHHMEHVEAEDFLFYALFDDRSLGKIAHSKQKITIIVYYRRKKKKEKGHNTLGDAMGVKVLIGKKCIAKTTISEAIAFYNETHKTQKME